MRGDRAFLDDILERIYLTQEFVKLGKDAFFNSRIHQEAVVRNFNIIGEATRHLSAQLRNQHSEVEWKRIVSHFVTTDYQAVKLEYVWNIIQNDLPLLKTQIEAILKDLDEAQDATKEQE